MARDDLIEIDGQVVHSTHRAWKFKADDKEEAVWLAKSQVNWDEYNQVMKMPEWIAIEKELI